LSVWYSRETRHEAVMRGLEVRKHDEVCRLRPLPLEWLSIFVENPFGHTPVITEKGCDGIAMDIDGTVLTLEQLSSVLYCFG
jgi:hypothetical protein